MGITDKIRRLAKHSSLSTGESVCLTTAADIIDGMMDRIIDQLIQQTAHAEPMPIIHEPSNNTTPLNDDAFLSEGIEMWQGPDVI